MNARRLLCLILAAALAVPASAQAPAAQDPAAKKKETYRVAGGARDGI